MGIFGRLRALAPVSSRSFHQFYGEFNEARSSLERMRSELEKTSALAKATDTHLQMMFWELYREQGETADEAKRRFFKSLPAATGVNRLLQLGNAQLLREFDEFCQGAGLRYWISYGTLLGAVRHGGAIPWDDDVDVSMTRTEIHRLFDALQDHPRLKIACVYDWYARARQIRVSYRNEDVPCFLDIFIYDFTTLDPHEAFSRVQFDRAQLLREFAKNEPVPTWNAQNYYLSAEAPEGRAIAERFDAALKTAYSHDGYLTDEEQEACGVVLAIDNMDAETDRDYLCLDDLFPLARVDYEGFSYNAPHDQLAALDALYDDPFGLPGDIHSHFAHVSEDILGNQETRDSLERLIETQMNA